MLVGLDCQGIVKLPKTCPVGQPALLAVKPWPWVEGKVEVVSSHTVEAMAGRRI